MTYRLYLMNQPHRFGERDDVDVFNPINRTGTLSDGTNFIVVKPIFDEIRDRIAGIRLEQDVFVENLFDLTNDMIMIIKTRIFDGPIRFEMA